MVTLIGSDGESAVTADDWAAWSDTIDYEIVARLPSDPSARIRRAEKRKRLTYGCGIAAGKSSVPL